MTARARARRSALRSWVRAVRLVLRRSAASVLPVALAVAFAAAGTGPGARAQAPAYDIRELQESGPALDWRSPHAGEIVGCVGGIVTHKFAQRIVLQDPSLGTEWAAVEVRGYPVYPSGIEIGDQVDFDNVYVDEFRGVTTLQYYSASSHVVRSQGHALPAPLPLPIWALAYPAQPEVSERYAAMLVSLREPVVVGALDLGAHEDNYELVGLAGPVLWGSDYANRDIDTTYHVSEGDCYARLTGLVQRYTSEEWDYYQLLPRANEDYVLCSTAVEDRLPAGGELRLTFPNPARLPAAFRYELAAAAPVRLEVFDASGRRIAVVDEGWRSPGPHAVIWSGGPGAGDSSGPGAPLAAGAYFVRLSAADRWAVRGLRLVR